jgi:hypothetical protein
MLEKSIRDFFNQAKQKCDFVLLHFSNTCMFKNGGMSLYRDGQEAQVPRERRMRGSGHCTVLKNASFITC